MMEAWWADGSRGTALASACVPLCALASDCRCEPPNVWDDSRRLVEPEQMIQGPNSFWGNVQIRVVH